MNRGSITLHDPVVIDFVGFPFLEARARAKAKALAKEVVDAQVKAEAEVKTEAKPRKKRIKKQKVSEPQTLPELAAQSILVASSSFEGIGSFGSSQPPLPVPAKESQQNIVDEFNSPMNNLDAFEGLTLVEEHR